MKRIIIGTRGSPLALAQVEIISGLLRQAHPDIELERKIIKTSGDKFLDLSLATGGGKGLFTKEIEEHLLAGDIDLAIHSLKDLPTELPAGLTLGAVPEREDPHDVFVSKRYGAFEELPMGARVATSSIRRKAQLLAKRPDLLIEEIRGNVSTRLQKLTKDPELAATILAAAGLKRLGLWQQIEGYQWQLLDFDVMIPAVGQGIIGCEVREADLKTQELLAAINHADTLACAEAERVFLKTLGGGCQVPYAGHATVVGEQMRLIAAVFSEDGRTAKRTVVTGLARESHALGERAASDCQNSLEMSPV